MSEARGSAHAHHATEAGGENTYAPDSIMDPMKLDASMIRRVGAHHHAKGQPFWPCC